jgi:probable HAF family extracellular repeat protein
MAMSLVIRKAQTACGRFYGLKLLECTIWGYSPVGILAEHWVLTTPGAVVGSSTSSFGDRAFIWTGNGGMQDLNNLASLRFGVVLLEAHSINNQGQILAMGGAMDEHHGNGGAASQCAPAPPASFLLTPPK